ncbi:MAG: hypothetical protein M3Q33_11355 [Acidobacteriota bacterium]|nr:hypothetical protein [Acidobacteriota bacterium]
MLTVRGKVHNGAVLPLEPISDAYEGREVIITLADETQSENQIGWKRLMAVIEENQIDADITDLAHQHDHYLYGTPKRED